MAELEAAVDAAESEEYDLQARVALLVQVVDLSFERHMASTLQTDPVVIRLVAQYELFQQLMERLSRSWPARMRAPRRACPQRYWRPQSEVPASTPSS